MPDARRVRVLVRADNFYPCPCPRLHAMEKGVEQQRDGLHTRTKQACWHGTKGVKTTTGPPANKTDKAGRRTRKSVGEPKSETQRPRRACDSHGVHPIYSPHVARSILTLLPPLSRCYASCCRVGARRSETGIRTRSAPSTTSANCCWTRVTEPPPSRCFARR